MKKIILFIAIISIFVFSGCQSRTSTVASGECPIGEPDCKDFVINPPIGGDSKEVLPGCVGDDCSIPPATEDSNISKPPASESSI